MAIFYPRKQTVIIFVVCLAIVLATAYFTSSGSQVSASDLQNTLSVSVPDTSDVKNQANLQNIDTTGLPDWKEQFSNAAKPDSGTKAPASPEKLTQTDSFARDFFTRYVELKQANLLNNDDIVNQTAADLVTAHISTDPAKVYAERDIHIVPSSQASLTSYSQAIARIMESYTIKKNEAAIIQDYLAKDDPNILKQITPIVTTYKRMISAIVVLPVPADLSEADLELLNSFSIFKTAAENLMRTDSDSVAGLSGVSSHAEGIVGMITALTDIHDTLRDKGVVFDFNQDILNVLLK
jgi:hypothetical protein